MIERTVLASFYSELEAKQAADAIKQLGVETAQVDQLHAYGGVIPEKRIYPISGGIPGLASLTLNTIPSSRDASILLAVDPAASGMSDGQENMTGRNFLLTVICQNKLVEQVVQIIRDNRGFT
jgi:hypothetical protein